MIARSEGQKFDAFHNEARIWNKLKHLPDYPHPNVITVYAVFRDKSSNFGVIISELAQNTLWDSMYENMCLGVQAKGAVVRTLIILTWNRWQICCIISW